MNTLLTGATGLTGTLFLERLAIKKPRTKLFCLVRANSDRSAIDNLNLDLTYYSGDSSLAETWNQIFSQNAFEIIIHLVQLRQVPILIDCLQKAGQFPRLIIIGTTGVYSKYNQYSAEYKKAETHLSQYSGSYCLLRPTMIYGSPRDKNLHKLISFCNRYGFFPIFGSGDNLIQPIHAGDIAQTLLTVWERHDLQGTYDLSGGSIVTFRELLSLISVLLDKPVRQLSLPLQLGINLATASEKLFGNKSPVKREQILRLQEDKAYSHSDAQRDLNFQPRSLEIGLQEEVNLMQDRGII